MVGCQTAWGRVAARYERCPIVFLNPLTRRNCHVVVLGPDPDGIDTCQNFTAFKDLTWPQTHTVFQTEVRKLRTLWKLVKDRSCTCAWPARSVRELTASQNCRATRIRQRAVAVQPPFTPDIDRQAARRIKSARVAATERQRAASWQPFARSSQGRRSVTSLAQSSLNCEEYCFTTSQITS